MPVATEPTIRRLIEDRIKSRVPGLRQVSGAADLESIRTNTITPPAIFVYRGSRDPTSNGLLSGVAQRVTESYAVVVITKNLRDARGAVSGDENEALCDRVGAALLGWQPNRECDELEYAGGRMTVMTGQLLVWTELYTTARHIRSV